MKKAERIRKLVTRISAGVIFAVLLVFTLQIGVQENSSSAMGLSALTFGLFSPAVAATSPGSGGGTCSGCIDCLGSDCGGSRSECGQIQNVKTTNIITCYFDNH